MILNGSSVLVNTFPHDLKSKIQCTDFQRLKGVWVVKKIHLQVIRKWCLFSCHNILVILIVEVYTKYRYKSLWKILNVVNPYAFQFVEREFRSMTFMFYSFESHIIKKSCQFPNDREPLLLRKSTRISILLHTKKTGSESFTQSFLL